MASVDAPIGDGDSDDLLLGDTIADEDSTFADEIANRDARMHVVQSMLDILDDRERRIVELRFGLDGADPATWPRSARRSASPASGSARSRPVLSKLRHPSMAGVDAGEALAS